MKNWDSLDAREDEYQDRQRIRRNRRARASRKVAENQAKAEQAKRRIEANA